MRKNTEPRKKSKMIYTFSNFGDGKKVWPSPGTPLDFKTPGKSPVLFERQNLNTPRNFETDG